MKGKSLLLRKNYRQLAQIGRCCPESLLHPLYAERSCRPASPTVAVVRQWIDTPPCGQPDRVLPSRRTGRTSAGRSAPPTTEDGTAHLLLVAASPAHALTLRTPRIGAMLNAPMLNARYPNRMRRRISLTHPLKRDIHHHEVVDPGQVQSRCLLDLLQAIVQRVSMDSECFGCRLRLGALLKPDL